MENKKMDTVMEWPRKANIGFGELVEITGWSKETVEVLRGKYPRMAWRLNPRGKFHYVTSVCRQIAEGRM